MGQPPLHSGRGTGKPDEPRWSLLAALGGSAGPAGPGRSPRCPLHPQCPVLSLPDVVKGLFVCCLFLDYVSLSQRFIPELLNFLLGILYIAAPGRPGQGEFIRGALPGGLCFAKRRGFIAEGLPCGRWKDDDTSEVRPRGGAFSPLCGRAETPRLLSPCPFCAEEVSTVTPGSRTRRLHFPRVRALPSGRCRPVSGLQLPPPLADLPRLEGEGGSQRRCAESPVALASLCPSVAPGC